MKDSKAGLSPRVILVHSLHNYTSVLLDLIILYSSTSYTSLLEHRCSSPPVEELSLITIPIL